MAILRSLRCGLVLSALSALSGSCGTQGDASVLPDRWPRSGLSGYRFLDADVPYALGRLGWDVDEPAVFAATGPLPTGPLPTGGDPMSATPATFDLWARMSPRLSPEKTVLCRATLRLAQPNAEAEPEEALGATLPWEGTGLRSPTVLLLSDDPSRPILLYQGEAGDVGAAQITPDGVEKISTTAPLIAADTLRAGQPGGIGRIAAVRDDDRVYVFYTLDERELRVAETDRESLLRYVRDASAPVTFRISPPLLHASAVAVPPGESKAIPAERIGQVSAQRVVTPVGRVRWDVALRAQAGRDSVLVAASAFAEPRTASSIGPAAAFLAVEAPLIKTSEGAVSAPALAALAGRPFLFFGLRAVATQIAVAGQPQ